MTSEQRAQKPYFEIHDFLKIEQKKMELKEHELKTHNLIWNDPKKAESHMKIIQGIKFWVTSFDDIQSHFDDLEVLQDFVKEGISPEEELDAGYSQFG